MAEILTEKQINKYLFSMSRTTPDYENFRSIEASHEALRAKLATSEAARVKAEEEKEYFHAALVKTDDLFIHVCEQREKLREERDAAIKRAELAFSEQIKWSDIWKDLSIKFSGLECQNAELRAGLESFSKTFEDAYSMAMKEGNPKAAVLFNALAAIANKALPSAPVEPQGKPIKGHGWITGTADVDALNAQAFRDDPDSPTGTEKCGVWWRLTNCPNRAAHRAVCTNGDRNTVFYVCRDCALMAGPLVYPDPLGFAETRMLPGDPLWLFWPPLDPPACHNCAGLKKALRLCEERLRWAMHQVCGNLECTDPGHAAGWIALVEVAGELSKAQLDGK